MSSRRITATRGHEGWGSRKVLILLLVVWLTAHPESGSFSEDAYLTEQGARLTT